MKVSSLTKSYQCILFCNKKCPLSPPPPHQPTPQIKHLRMAVFAFTDDVPIKVKLINNKTSKWFVHDDTTTLWVISGCGGPRYLLMALLAVTQGWWEQLVSDRGWPEQHCSVIARAIWPPRLDSICRRRRASFPPLLPFFPTFVRPLSISRGSALAWVGHLRLLCRLV